MKTIHVLIGLPGSGKTYFSKEYCDKIINYCMRFDIDYVLLNGNRVSKTKSAFNTVVETLISDTVYNKQKFNTYDYMVDGLFTKSNDIVKVIEAINEVIIHNKPKKSPKINAEIILHYWNEDRESCLENDTLRFERPANSKTSIKYLDYIDLNDEEVFKNLKKEIQGLEIKGCLEIKNVKIKKHEVYKMDEMTRKIKATVACLEYPDIKNNKLYSSYWCMGGAHGNCFNDELYPIDGEEPSEFEQFDDILANLTPNVTFIDYKRIKKQCVKMEESFESDYYGGGCTNGRWVCDLEKFVNAYEKYGYKIKNN